MIEQDIPDCTLGLTTDTLSAWRDGGFQGDDEQRIRQHATTCAACQQRLNGFATVARALERQQELEPGDRVWRGVQNRIASQRRTGIILPRSLGWSWQGMVAAASVILVVSLLAYVFNAARTQRSGPTPTSTATSMITPTPVATLTSSVITPGPRLSWQQAHLPSGVEVTMASLASRTLAVAPSDGDVAYLCVAPIEKEGHAQETNAHVYITRDRGQTWARGADVPVGAQPQSSGKPFVLTCTICVDALRPDIAVVETMWLQTGASGDISLISSFASFDYGAHWRKLVYPSPFAIGAKTASYAGSIYAFGDAQIRGGVQGLWVSRDQMTTWQTLALPADLDVNAFWLNPSTGALLLAANRQGSPMLFSSVDGGARWTQLPAPSTPGITWGVQPPRAAAPWHICGAVASSGIGSQAQGNTLTCSSDGGQTWATRPALNLAQNSPKGFQFFPPASVLALTSDGAALATFLPLEGAIHLYRLQDGGSSWQDLGGGPADPSNSTYSPTSTSGALWLSGSDVFTAPYPPA
jgi:hypothetical protein